MGDEEPLQEADPSLSWQDLPECVKKALDQESRQPSPEILSNLFSDDSDIKDFVESLGLTMGSTEWFSACEILEKVCADVSQAADRVVRTRAVQGQLAQTSSSISAGPQQQLEVSTGWLQTRAGAKRSLTSWPCRLAKKLALAKHDRARADAEAAELRRWRRALAKELKRACMPVCSMAGYALDSQAGAWLLHSDWLAAGYEIWASDGFAFSRDYLVPRPTKGLTSCLPVMASYVDMSTMSKQLLWELKRPELTEAGSVRHTDVALFEDPSLDDLFQALQRAGVESSVRDRALDLLRPLEGWVEFRAQHLAESSGNGVKPGDLVMPASTPEGQQAAQADASGSEDFSSSTSDEAQTSGESSSEVDRAHIESATAACKCTSRDHASTCKCTPKDCDLELGKERSGLMEPEPASEPSAELHERESTDDTFLLLSDHVWELEQRVAVLERRLIAVDPVPREDLRREITGISRAFFGLADRVSGLELRVTELENVSQGLDSPPQSDISFLYLFAGESRRADLKSFLAAACEKAGLSFRYQEVDIGESAPDVLSDSFWLRLLNQVRRHEFNLLFMSPPYSTFNRATFVNRTGPPPLRNSDWPEGFPWLSGVWKSRAEAGTSLVRRVLSLATLATNEHVPWLIEHPEFLGATAAGTPASIWTWEEAVRVFQETRATSVALHLCAFGAAQRRPTRLAGTWHGLRSVGVAGWPRLDPQQHYRGPLSRKCGHAHAPLIGTDENGHFLAGPAAYPSGFCEALASIAVLTFRQRVSSESVLGEGQARSSDTLENATSTAVVHQAEALALRLQHSAVSKESLLQIFDLLPGEELARDGVTWQDSKSFAVGAYAVGGWSCADSDDPRRCRWFAERIKPEDAPLFFMAGESYRSIASLELLATMVAVLLFAPTGAGPSRTVCSAGTDNKGNSHIVSRWLTTSFPLVAVLMELTAVLLEKSCMLELTRAPRLQNMLADSLTNGDFKQFDPKLRLRFSFAEYQGLVLRPLLQAGSALYGEIAEWKEKRGPKSLGGASKNTPASQHASSADARVAARAAGAAGANSQVLNTSTEGELAEEHSPLQKAPPDIEAGFVQQPALVAVKHHCFCTASYDTFKVWLEDNGVAVLISHRVAAASSLQHCIVVPGRLLHVRFPVGQGRQARHVDVACCYQWSWDADPAKQRLDKRLSYWRRLNTFVQGLPARNVKCIGGDFNCALKAQTKHIGTGLHASDFVYPDSNDFTQTMIAANLCALNTWGPSKAAYTYRLDGQCPKRSQIDFIFASLPQTDAQAKQACTDRAINFAPWRGLDSLRLSGARPTTPEDVNAVLLGQLISPEAEHDAIIQYYTGVFSRDVGARSRRDPLHLSFGRGGLLSIDMSKAFDYVSHSYLASSLRHLGIREDTVQLEAGMHVNSDKSSLLLRSSGSTLAKWVKARTFRRRDQKFIRLGTPFQPIDVALANTIPYLGTVMSFDAFETRTADLRIRQAKAAVARLSRVLFKKQGNPRKEDNESIEVIFQKFGYTGIDAFLLVASSHTCVELTLIYGHPTLIFLPKSSIIIGSNTEGPNMTTPAALVKEMFDGKGTGYRPDKRIREDTDSQNWFPNAEDYQLTDQISGEEVRRLLAILTRLCLRQEDDIAATRADSAFLFYMETKPEICMKAGWMQETTNTTPCWTYAKWDSEKKVSIVDTSKTPVAHSKILDAVAHSLKLLGDSSLIHRFRATRPLAETYESNILTFLMLVSNRGQEAENLFSTMALLTDCNATQLMRTRFAKERLRRQPLAQILQREAYNLLRATNPHSSNSSGHA
ncbi:unnamed protein product [Symbiodinium sp. CCMP2592]|nr:unnamed protein product [Symbiodinium sp. CCMP2592]